MSTSLGSVQADGGSETALGTGSSAQLYLYVFLGTLLFLFGVGGVVLMGASCVQRRRRRIIDEAIENGTWNPPGVRYYRVDLKMKPKMWDARIVTPLDSPPAKWEHYASYLPSATNSDSTFATAFTSISAPRSAFASSTPSLHAPPANTRIPVELPPRVHAAFIAMPVPRPVSSSASASATSLAPSLDSAPTPPTPVWVSSISAEDDEIPLPYLEMGTLVANLVPAAPLGRGSGGESEDGNEGGSTDYYGDSGSEEGSNGPQCGLDV